MCGILGSNFSKESVVDSALSTMTHRGPDYGNVISKNKWVFGHRRLAIIDLNRESNQPFTEGPYTLTFNGEIYNFKEIRTELEEEGISFKTDSDTEVLFRLMVHKGEKAIASLRGMFAFVFYDEELDRLLLARDSFGIKPLYYYHLDGSICFGSTITALKELGVKTIVDDSAIAEFLVCGFVNEPRTGFQNIKKLPPQTYAVFSDGTLTIREYKCTNVTSKNLRESLKMSIQEQLNSDVPVGLFFSGGVDSSLLLSFLFDKDDIDVVTVREKREAEKAAGKSSDYNAAQEIAARNNVKISYLDIDSHKGKLLEDIAFIMENIEELIADHTFLPSYQMSANFRRNGKIVALSGMGADELFFGYNRFRALKYKWLLNLLSPFLSILDSHPYWTKKTDRLRYFILEKNPFFAYYSLVSPFNLNEVRNLLKNENELNRIEFFGYDKKARLTNADLLEIERMGFLAHNLTVADKSSMLASIELRVPLLSEILLEYARSRRAKGFVFMGITKAPLKVLAIGFMGLKSVFRAKRGFNPILDTLLDELGEEQLLKELNLSPIFNYITKEETTKIAREHFAGRKNHTYKIYNLLCLAKWLQINLDK
jgi:asparagine synthase (glutamine-hydrolysing)